MCFLYLKLGLAGLSTVRFNTFLLLFLWPISGGAEPLRSSFPVPQVCWEGTREEAYEMGSLHEAF